MTDRVTLDTVLNSTLTRSRKKLIMAVAKAHVLVAWAMANNRVEYETGGHDITNPMITGRNPNVAAYQYYDQLPINQTDEFDTISYTWSRVAGTLVISQQEIDENAGDTKIFDILEKKMLVLEESIKEKFGEYMYGIGAGMDPNGLGLLIPSDPTTGTIGGKSRATYNWLRTSSYDTGGAINASNIEAFLDDLDLDLKVKDERPDVYLVGRNLYRMYRQAVRDKFTIELGNNGGASKKMFDLGFKGVAHNGIPILYDEDCDVDTMFAINSKYLKLHILRSVNMRVQKLNAPWNVDAMGRRVVWQGQWCMWRFWRTHARVDNAA